MFVTENKNLEEKRDKLNFTWTRKVDQEGLPRNVWCVYVCIGDKVGRTTRLSTFSVNTGGHEKFCSLNLACRIL